MSTLSRPAIPFVLTLAIATEVILVGTSPEQRALAQAPSKRDAHLEACFDKFRQLHEEADAALKTYINRLVAQPRNAPWQPDTCKALKLSIAASQKRIDWPGRGNRVCASFFNSPESDAARANMRGLNDKKRALYRENCQ